MMPDIVVENSGENIGMYLRNKRQDKYSERANEYLRNKRYERTEANYRVLKDACERLKKKLEDLLRSKYKTYDEKKEEVKGLVARLRELEEKLDRAAEDSQKESRVRLNGTPQSTKTVYEHPR